MGIARRLNSRGQMTVELAVAMPVLIAIAVMAVNLLTFFADCASFDRAARDSVRIHATSPAYGQGADQACASVQGDLEAVLDADNLDIAVSHAVTGFDLDEYRCVLVYSPTLFGLGLRSEVFGVTMPQLRHEVSCVVDSYKPGVVV